MKKFLIQIFFLISVLPGMAQGSIYIQGTVTDSLTGNPVANHAVTISSDSSSGFSYYQIVYTDLNGFYVDTVGLNGVTVNTMLVSTLDCNQLPHQDILLIQAGVITYTSNFEICVISIPCEAGFTQSQNQPYVVEFVNTSEGGGNLWQWSFGDGSSSSDENPVHTYSAEGFYSVVLVIGDEFSGCLDTVSSMIFVSGTGVNYLKINGTVSNQTSGNPMPNHPVTWGLSDTLTGPRTTYTNASGFYSDSLLLPSGITSGEFYIWTKDCHYTTFISSPFSLNQLSFTWDFNLYFDLNPPCVTKMKVTPAGLLTVQFNDVSLGGSTARLWSFGDGTTSTDRDPLHTYPKEGEYAVRLFTNNEITGCSDSASFMVRFPDSLLCYADFSCTRDQGSRNVQFNNLSSGPDLCHWNFRDGKTSSEKNPQHTFNFPGLYLVDLSVGDSTTLCTSLTSHEVLVSDTLIPCRADFTTKINPAFDKKSVQFTDASTGIPDSWHWSFGDGISADERFPIHTYATQGTYSVCLTIAGDSCSDTFCSDVTITDTTIFHQVYGQVFAGNFPITSGEAMIFSTDTTGSSQPFTDMAPIDSLGVYYFTLVPEGSYYLLAIPSDSTEYLPTYYGDVVTWQQASIITLGTASNPYNISLSASGQMATGPGSASGQINVTGARSTEIDKANMILHDVQGTPVGFSPVSSGGTFGFSSLAYGSYYLHAEMPGITSDYVPIELTPEKPDATVVMTFTGSRIIGIKEGSPMVTQWIVYPNPFADELTVEVDMLQAAEASVNIFNFSGQLQLTMAADFKAGQNIITIPAMDLQPGTYILRIFSPEGLNLHRKLIKR